MDSKDYSLRQRMINLQRDISLEQLAYEYQVEQLKRNVEFNKIMVPSRTLDLRVEAQTLELKKKMIEIQILQNRLEQLELENK